MIFVVRRALSIMAVVFAAMPVAHSQLSEAISQSAQTTGNTARAQEQINNLDDARVEIESEYRALLQRRNASALFVDQQQRVIDAQQREMASLLDQLARIDEISLQMAPMMRDMQATLFAFRQADLPFKVMTSDGLDVRAARYEQLESMADRADISPGERYRLLLEAFQSEMEYGNVIDTYRDDIVVGGETRTVDIFRYGRVAMVYLTEDRREAGRWNRKTGKWELLPDSYIQDINQAIRIASNVAAPVVLTGPVEKFSVRQVSE